MAEKDTWQIKHEWKPPRCFIDEARECAHTCRAYDVTKGDCRLLCALEAIEHEASNIGECVLAL